MANLHRVRDLLVESYIYDLIDDEDFQLLYDLNTPSNPDFQYDSTKKFSLDDLNNDESNSYYRFQKEHLHDLCNVLHIPQDFILNNGSKIPGIEALCVTLQKYTYPCRYGDMVKIYNRSVPQLSLIFKKVTDFVYDHNFHRFAALNQPWLSPAILQTYADAVYAKGAALDNCWGFIDGTIRPSCRPSLYQGVMYNGHKRLHGLKYQAIATPSGMIAHLYGPEVGRHHDARLFHDSHILEQLEVHSFGPNGNPLCIYGDPAYPLRPQMQVPFPTTNITHEKQMYNASMSKVRIAVEWVFGEVLNFFKFNEYKRPQNVLLSAPGKMYIVSCLFTNAHTCLYGNRISSYFDVKPPTLQEYFS